MATLATVLDQTLVPRLLDGIAEAVSVYCPDEESFRCIAINTAAIALLGYAPTEAVGKWVDELLPAVSPGFVGNLLRDVWRSGHALTREGRFAMPAGPRTLSLTVTPVYDDAHAVSLLVGTLRDVTSVQGGETPCLAPEARYRVIVDAMAEGVILQDVAGVILVANSSAAQLLGLTTMDLIGRTHRDPHWRIVREDGTPMPINEYPTRKVIHTGEPCMGAVIGVYRPNGSLVWLRMHALPIFHPTHHRPSAAIATFTDITSERETEAAWRQKQKEISAEHRARSEFLAYMSHELRTPLQAIMGYAELLRDEAYGSLSSDQKSFATDIHTAGEYLLSLVNDILDLSKVEAGRMELRPTAIDVPLLVGSCMAMVHERAKMNGVMVTADVGKISALVADQRMLKQVLVNLLANAVQFTSAGGRVRLTVREREGMVRFAVADTGVGISEDDQEHLFETYVQFGDAPVGTGLGLVLTKRLVELHGGTITVRSTLGIGSEFVVALPVAPLFLSQPDVAPEPLS